MRARKKITPETALKHTIRDYLRFRGWLIYHNLAGLGSYPGIPDMTAIKGGRVIQIEAKAPRGVQSDRQKDFEREWVERGGVYILARTLEEVMEGERIHMEADLYNAKTFTR